MPLRVVGHADLPYKRAPRPCSKSAEKVGEAPGNVIVPYTSLLKGRHSLPNQAYLLTWVTLDRAPVFSDFRAARLLVGEVRRMHEQKRVDSLAWVVMPDHLHWLVQLHAHWPLAPVVKTVKGRSALAINGCLDRRGPLWQRGYHDHAIRRGEDILSVARYIVANPLRAGLAGEIGQYPHWDCIWMSDTQGGSVLD